MSQFGELQMVNSRAVSDDEDDEFSLIKENEDLKQTIYWLTDDLKDTKLTVDQLIVADGQISSAFLYTYLTNHLNDAELRKIALSTTKSQYKVYQTNNEDTQVKQPQSLSTLRTNFIYHVSNLDGKSYIICQLFNQMKSNEVYDWIDQLWKRVEFKSTLILCSQNSSNYFGANEDQHFPCVKFLTSDKLRAATNEKTCSRLEEPNIIGQLPAGLVHFCVLKSIPFTTFVCYSKSLVVDLLSVKEFYKSISDKLKTENIFIDNEHSKKTLLQMDNIVNSVSALYM